MTSKRMRGSSATGRPVTPAPEAQAPSAVVIAAEAPLPAPTALAIPLSSRAVFWRPRFAGATRSLVHLPFLFWLIETLRPVRIAQLGLEDPGAYLGLCQAVDKCGLEAICMAVEADPARPALTGDSARQHATLYSDFSFVAAEDIGGASRHMRSGGIDLLVLDMPLTAEVVTQLQTHWLPGLSERGVLVIHDPQTRLADPAARAFVADLQRSRPGISFPQAKPGLEVILCGDQQNDRLLRLAELEIGMPGHLAAYQVFARLGQGLAAEQQAQTGSRTLEREVTARKALTTQVETLEAQLAQERGEKAAVLAAETTQVLQLANLQHQLLEERKAREQGGPELAELRAERSLLQAQLAAAEAERQDLQQRNAVLARQLAEAARAGTQAEAALRETLEAVQTELAQSQEARKKTASHRAKLEQQLAEAAAAATQAEAAQRKALEAARSELAQSQEAGKKTASHRAKLEQQLAEAAAAATQSEAALRAALEAKDSQAGTLAAVRAQLSALETAQAMGADRLEHQQAELLQSREALQQGAAQRLGLERQLAEAAAAAAQQEAALAALKAELAAEPGRQAERSAALAAELAAELTAGLKAELALREAALEQAAGGLAEEKARHAAQLSEAAAALAAAAEESRAATEAHQAQLGQLKAERQETEGRNEGLTEEIVRLREQLRQSRERRLSVWESQERLRSEHEALLAREVLHISSVEK